MPQRHPLCIPSLKKQRNSDFSEFASTENATATSTLYSETNDKTVSKEPYQVSKETYQVSKETYLVSKETCIPRQVTNIVKRDIPSVKRDLPGVKRNLYSKYT